MNLVHAPLSGGVHQPGNGITSTTLEKIEQISHQIKHN